MTRSSWTISCWTLLFLAWGWIDLGISSTFAQPSNAQEPLRAGTAKIEITNPQTSRVHDPCFAKALVCQQGDVSAVVITLDAVAVGGIGAIRNSFMETVRQELARDPGIAPANVLVNASHCHGNVRSDCEESVVAMVREAWRKLQPVQVGVGSAVEAGISENRRVRLKDGSQVDMRRAYAMAWDDEIASIGPIDPQVGIVKLTREDGSILAVLYNFACHPIMNPPSKGSSADLVGVASTLIEKALIDEQTMAFFVQGCGGDINPLNYKGVDQLGDAEPLGKRLGASVLTTLASIHVKAGTLAVQRRFVSIPRADDFQVRIEAIESLRNRLLSALKPTNINFKSFLPLLMQQRLFPDFPSAGAQAYLHRLELHDDQLQLLDKEKQSQVEAYLANIQIMEQLTRLNTNLDLLRMHQEKASQAAVGNLECELCGLRLGEFKLVTFPGELTCEIGLNLKRISPKHTFVAGYTNGYVHYLPTLEQRNNSGFAQEDCDCMVAPQWQRIFEEAAQQLIKELN
jgi:hypothetical protein